MSSGTGTGLSRPPSDVTMTAGGTPRSRWKSLIREEAASSDGGTSK